MGRERKKGEKRAPEWQRGLRTFASFGDGAAAGGHRLQWGGGRKVGGVRERGSVGI